jgi:FixJ family two-component response regulator
MKSATHRLRATLYTHSCCSCHALHNSKVALGHTSAEIAEELSLSAKTVETYRARGMEKLSLRTMAALVKYALQEGLINQE